MLNSTTSIESLFRGLTTLSVKEFKPPPVQPEAIPTCPVTWDKETNPHLATASFQVLVESNEVSPEPPSLRLLNSSSSSDLCSRPYPNSVALPSTIALLCLSCIEEPRTELSTHSRSGLTRYVYFYVCVCVNLTILFFGKVKKKKLESAWEKMGVTYALADFRLMQCFILCLDSIDT